MPRPSRGWLPNILSSTASLKRPRALTAREPHRTFARRLHRPRRRNLAVKLLLIGILSQMLISGAQAQGMTGRYVGRSEDGPIAVTLRHESNGTLTGSLDRKRTRLNSSHV